jgi:tRNA pseudouridine38-40 synthase
MRIALGVEYDGSLFYGWQAQRDLPTVQGHLESAISKVANEPVHLFCAGRTDAHVHATGQVIHFDTRAKRHVDAWIWGVNSHLPHTIVVKWARQVDYHFHARFGALSRRYRYVIYNHPIRPALLNNQVSWYYYRLDFERMKAALPFLLGEQDFSSFRSSQCQSKSPMRCVMDVKMESSGHFISFEIEANAFLHHMVRNIAGVLIKIGAGFHEPSWMETVLQAKSRKAAAGTASASGLYLTKVTYPEAYSFPEPEPFFFL